MNYSATERLEIRIKKIFFITNSGFGSFNFFLFIFKSLNCFCSVFFYFLPFFFFIINFLVFSPPATFVFFIFYFAYFKTDLESYSFALFQFRNSSRYILFFISFFLSCLILIENFFEEISGLKSHKIPDRLLFEVAHCHQYWF